MGTQILIKVADTLFNAQLGIDAFVSDMNENCKDICEC